MFSKTEKFMSPLGGRKNNLQISIPKAVSNSCCASTICTGRTSPVKRE